MIILAYRRSGISSYRHIGGASPEACWDHPFLARVWGFVGLGFPNLGLRVQGVLGLAFRVVGLGFRVLGFRV